MFIYPETLANADGRYDTIIETIPFTADNTMNRKRIADWSNSTLVQFIDSTGSPVITCTECVWNPCQGITPCGNKAANTQGAPVDPVKKSCDPGNMNVDEYTCAACSKGFKADAKGLPMCTACYPSQYAGEEGSAQCTACPAGSEAWIDGAVRIEVPLFLIPISPTVFQTSVNACRCQLHFFASNVYKIENQVHGYTSEGCFAKQTESDLTSFHYIGSTETMDHGEAWFI